MRVWEFYVYIVTNANRTVLYVGVTNCLEQRLTEHYLSRGKESTFAGRYFCHHLLYFEVFKYVNDAIAREKEIKGWRREKKEALISGGNPDWHFLNDEVMRWPPPDSAVSRRA